MPSTPCSSGFFLLLQAQTTVPDPSFSPMLFVCKRDAKLLFISLDLSETKFAQTFLQSFPIESFYAGQRSCPRLHLELRFTVMDKEQHGPYPVAPTVLLGRKTRNTQTRAQTIAFQRLTGSPGRMALVWGEGLRSLSERTMVQLCQRDRG